MNRDNLLMFQQEQAATSQAELEQRKQIQEQYFESEQYQKDCWDAAERRWAEKAKKEGWHYVVKPFISSFEKEKMAEKEKAEQIAFLKAKLQKLESE